MARIMMVDDEEMTLNLVGQVVGLLGHQAIPAQSGATALELLEEGFPDLILMDLMMPEMDGYETMRHIRALPGSSDIPIVVMTASQELDVEERVADAGGDRVVYKPMSVAKLSAVVTEYLAARIDSDTSPLAQSP